MTKFRLDVTALNGHDYIAIEETVGKPWGEALQTAAGLYAALWRMKQRDDPTFTYDQALELSLLRDVEIVNQDAEGEALAAGNGGSPSVSPAPGG